MNPVIAELLTGKPVELTSADPQTVEAREVLESTDQIYTDPNSREDYDFGGSVFWDERKSRAIIVF